ncbi:hypothetical protein [Kineobactrum salinum]|uniref:Uncharacterized protein n=1 Tax=Kineobactrum salinum TaxID=2708301 RepID=A0A6C0U250_9GAMM|nr:hypothetical protein [Kineobactrum salinum]QIB64445.1 hypothetical protein G3T16_02560 [Kineobactrum salinum]
MARFLLTLAVIGLLASNFLVLTWNAATIRLSDALESVGVSTVYGRLQEHRKGQDRHLEQALTEQRTMREQVRYAGESIRQRTVKSAAANIGSLPAEAVPYLGWAVVVGVTDYELMLACENLQELESLYHSLGVAVEADPEAMQLICEPEIKTFSEAYARIPDALAAEYAEFQEWANSDPAPTGSATVPPVE